MTHRLPRVLHDAQRRARMASQGLIGAALDGSFPSPLASLSISNHLLSPPPLDLVHRHERSPCRMPRSPDVRPSEAHRWCSTNRARLSVGTAANIEATGTKLAAAIGWSKNVRQNDMRKRQLPRRPGPDPAIAGQCILPVLAIEWPPRQQCATPETQLTRAQAVLPNHRAYRIHSGEVIRSADIVRGVIRRWWRR